MSTFAAITDNERDNLLAFLDAQRDAFGYTAYGLSDEQARLRPTAGTLSVGGLIKHVTQMELGWVTLAESGAMPETDYVGGFTMNEDETLEGLLAELAECGRNTRRVVESLPLDHPVPVPEAPWFPKDLESWPLRWVLGHLLEELTRHAGHGDIVRESIDGKTMFELQAMADGWYEQYQQMMRSMG